MSDDADNTGEGSKSPEEILEDALEGLSREDIEREKFDDPERGLEIAPEDYQVADDGTDAVDAEEASDSASKEADNENDGDSESERQARRQREMFERAMSDVERMESSGKYRTSTTPDPDEAADRASAVGERTPDDLKTPTLPKSGDELRRAPPLNERQQAFQKRFEAWAADNELPEINLRGESTGDAISRLSSFLAQARHHDCQFIRIVTGRGRRSDGPPAIKLAVLNWLEGRGIAHIEGYIPERLVDGDYGSLVVELRD